MAYAYLHIRTLLSRSLGERGDRGASLVEYALLLALIAIVCLVAVNTIGTPTSTGISKGASAFGP